MRLKPRCRAATLATYVFVSAGQIAMLCAVVAAFVQ
jgi:hypothetical protein